MPAFLVHSRHVLPHEWFYSLANTVILLRHKTTSGGLVGQIEVNDKVKLCIPDNTFYDQRECIVRFVATGYYLLNTIEGEELGRPFGAYEIALLEKAQKENEVYLIIWKSKTDKPYEADLSDAEVFEDTSEAEEFLKKQTEKLENDNYNVWFTLTKRPRKVSVLVEKTLQVV